ncbi:hypothetical protein RRG08_003513 [Elysia crispata]|uniref:Uncharacterized protein n=1 Tax=Elysia crispata TaxID=231223 RepID=A0AAE1CTA7_9GAST|nr:hypothetical protein RRG08_003513 [Elysia crispata]
MSGDNTGRTPSRWRHLLIMSLTLSSRGDFPACVLTFEGASIAEVIEWGFPTVKSVDIINSLIHVTSRRKNLKRQDMPKTL